MARSSYFGTVSAALFSILFLAWYVPAPLVQAQSGKTKSKPPKVASASEVRQIDARLEKLSDTFQRESTAIIKGYEDSGQYERAKFLLEVLLKLDPKNEELKKKMSHLDDHILERTEFDTKLDTSKDWAPVGNVQKDKPARVEAEGEYKFSLTATNMTADGFPTENAARDLVGKVPLGALMGMIMTQETQSGKQPPEVFPIKSKHDFTPKHDGTLFLKINLPPGSKCNGDLKLKLSGVTRG